MVTLRCTQRLLKRLKAKPPRPSVSSAPPSAKLGDWYAQLTVVDRRHLVLAVSERTLLPVVVPLAPSTTFIPRFRDTCEEVLRALRVAERDIAFEKDAMTVVELGRTVSPQVLGSINDFVRMLDAYLERGEYVHAALQLAEAPCGPIGMESPRQRTIDVLSMRRPPPQGDEPG